MPDLSVHVIGDSGPFSQLGKSIGYCIEYDGANYLLDCGAPVFQTLGTEGLENLDGIIGTHAHEDHKRWFTDVALYAKFTINSGEQIPLLGTRSIINDYRTASSAALERTLTMESDDIRTLAFEDYVNPIRIGPEPKVKCKFVHQESGEPRWEVVGQDGQNIPRDEAKIVKTVDSYFPSLLYKDPVEDIWVDPETYYSYDDERFYDQSENSNSHNLTDSLTITPYKAGAWHGPPTNSILFECPEGKLYFSSDTVYDPELWNSLTDRKSINPEEETSDFHDKRFLTGKIENFTQQVWSSRRLDKALSLYENNYVFIHDVAAETATVHTPYSQLEDFDGEILLTHSPDEFITTEPMAHLGKSYLVQDDEIYEETLNGDIYPLDATCYIKRYSEYLVGYEDPDGSFHLLKEGPGQYKVKSEPPSSDESAELVCKISLYEDLGGEYFPVLPEEKKEYRLRHDGDVEQITYNGKKSEGKLIDGKRSELIQEPQHS